MGSLEASSKPLSWSILCYNGLHLYSSNLEKLVQAMELMQETLASERRKKNNSPEAIESSSNEENENENKKNLN